MRAPRLHERVHAGPARAARPRSLTLSKAGPTVTTQPWPQTERRPLGPRAASHLNISAKTPRGGKAVSTPFSEAKLPV